MPSEELADRDLLTIRDWLRFAVSRFNEAGLAYGHGTAGALDEAAFIVLETLHLPLDELEPWLEARLTGQERRVIADLLQRRIETRKPAAYLLGKAYIRGRAFLCDERAIVPRSYIGELLANRIDEGDESFPPFPLPQPVGQVLDLCTGGGSLAILAAEAFPEANIDAVDISKEALQLARENVAKYGLEERITLLEGDLFERLKGKQYDLILCNPPYVTDDSVQAFAQEYKAEPRLAHAGGADGLQVVRRVLADAAGFLSVNGQLVVEVGMAGAVLEDTYPALPLVWLETAASEGEVFAISAQGLRDAMGS